MKTSFGTRRPAVYRLKRSLGCSDRSGTAAAFRTPWKTPPRPRSESPRSCLRAPKRSRRADRLSTPRRMRPVNPCSRSGPTGRCERAIGPRGRVAEAERSGAHGERLRRGDRRRVVDFDAEAPAVGGARPGAADRARATSRARFWPTLRIRSRRRATSCRSRSAACPTSRVAAPCATSGVELALFGRFGRHALRFQINRAVSPHGGSRALRGGAARTAWSGEPRTFASGREKARALLQPLERRAPIFVTPRPWVVGSEIDLELPDRGRPTDAWPGRIVYTNAGRRSSPASALPRGMAVRFAPTLGARAVGDPSRA